MLESVFNIKPPNLFGSWRTKKTKAENGAHCSAILHSFKGKNSDLHMNADV